MLCFHAYYQHETQVLVYLLLFPINERNIFIVLGEQPVESMEGDMPCSFYDQKNWDSCVTSSKPGLVAMEYCSIVPPLLVAVVISHFFFITITLLIFNVITLLEMQSSWHSRSV